MNKTKCDNPTPPHGGCDCQEDCPIPSFCHFRRENEGAEDPVRPTAWERTIRERTPLDVVLDVALLPFKLLAIAGVSLSFLIIASICLVVETVVGDDNDLTRLIGSISEKWDSIKKRIKTELGRN